MGHSYRRIASALFALALLLASPAFGNPVTFGTGAINVAYHDTFNGEDQKSFTVTAPGSATESYDGTPLVNDGTGLGDNRGNSGATDDIKDLADGASFEASIFHSNKGDDERTAGGSVDFGVNFTTDRPLHYVWNINPTGASTLSASLDQLIEGLQIDVFGNASGSLIQDGGVISKTLQGTLPAGAHGLSLSMDIINGRSSNGVPHSEASISLTLSDQGGPAVIPLPPAAWSGLMMLMVAGGAIRRLQPKLKA